MFGGMWSWSDTSLRPRHLAFLCLEYEDTHTKSKPALVGMTYKLTQSALNVLRKVIFRVSVETDAVHWKHGENLVFACLSNVGQFHDNQCCSVSLPHGVWRCRSCVSLWFVWTVVEVLLNWKDFRHWKCCQIFKIN